jgi:23S rRNA pseudouridine2605 synthase
MEERIQKIIARAGIASRRHAEEMITSGLVTVNGATVTELGSKADESRDHIKVAGKLLRPAQERVYMLLHKPVEVVSTMSDPEGRRALSDMLYGISERVFPVGRLEYHAAGLVFLTNDGDLANLLLRSHRVRQTYHLKLKTLLTFAEIETLGRATGAHIERLSGKESPWYIVTLSEARSDALRDKLFQTGHPVEKIRRVGIANLELGSLASGSHRALTSVELAAFRRAIAADESSAEKDSAAPPRSREKHSSRPTLPGKQAHVASRNSWRAGKHGQRPDPAHASPRFGQHPPRGPSDRDHGRSHDRDASRASQHNSRGNAPGSHRNTSHGAPSRPAVDGNTRDTPRNPSFRPGQHGQDRNSPHKHPGASPRTGPPNARYNSPRNAPGNPPRNSSHTGHHKSDGAPPRTGPPNARYNTPRNAPANAPRTGQNKPQGTSPRGGEHNSHSTTRYAGPPNQRHTSPGNAPGNKPRNGPGNRSGNGLRDVTRDGRNKPEGTSPRSGQHNSSSAPRRVWQPNPRHTPSQKGPQNDPQNEPGNTPQTGQHKPGGRRNKF